MENINKMIDLVLEGNDPEEVLENSLDVYPQGKDTTLTPIGDKPTTAQLSKISEILDLDEIKDSKIFSKSSDATLFKNGSMKVHKQSIVKTAGKAYYTVGKWLADEY